MKLTSVRKHIIMVTEEKFSEINVAGLNLYNKHTQITLK